MCILEINGVLNPNLTFTMRHIHKWTKAIINPACASFMRM